MIICGNSKIQILENGVKIEIDEKISDSMGLFPGQILFGDFNEVTKRFFLSPLRLNPHVSYFRIFLEDVRGSLAQITAFFSARGINILSGGAFGLGNLWISEFVADFKNVDVSPEAIVSDIEGMGGFVTSREITELFPRAFELTESYRIETSSEGGMFLLLEKTPIQESNHAVLKAWPQVQTLFLDLYSPHDKLLKISAKIKDVPGSLTNLVGVIKNQVNLVAIDERHHDEVSGVWTIYGVLEIGSVKELEERAENTTSIIKFDVEALGW